MAEAFGATPCAAEDELLASDLDVVYIATPTWLHCDQVMRAAASGKHVLCEKPLGMSVAECDQMIAACKDAGVKLGVGFMMRYQSQHRAALHLLENGQLGRLVFARAQLSCWYPPIENAWRQTPEQGGGGSLMDLGGHCVDLLEMLMGPIRSVQCSTGRLVHDYASEDTAVALLEFVSGAKGVVDCLFNVPDAASLNRLEVYGSQGSILAEGAIGQGEAGHMTARFSDASSAYSAEQQRADGGGVTIAPEPVNMYRAEVEAFAKAVLEDAPPPISGEDGRHSQAVLAACYESAKSGMRVIVS